MGKIFAPKYATLSMGYFELTYAYLFSRLPISVSFRKLITGKISLNLRFAKISTP